MKAKLKESLLKQETKKKIFAGLWSIFYLILGTLSKYKESQITFLSFKNLIFRDHLTML